MKTPTTVWNRKNQEIAVKPVGPVVSGIQTLYPVNEMTQDGSFSFNVHTGDLKEYPAR